MKFINSHERDKDICELKRRIKDAFNRILCAFMIAMLIIGCTQKNSTGKISAGKENDVIEIAEDVIHVDASKILNNTRRRQIGINTCFFTDDDDCYFRKPVRPFNEALKELNVKYFRYPGGWKSDVLFWSKPPY